MSSKDVLFSNRTLVPKSAFSNVKDPNKIYTYPSYTYDLLVPEERILGHTDHVDSVAQASDLILHIERFSTDIYSDHYGIQINDLYGKKSSYVKAKLEYRILDALSVDDRIIDVYDYRSEILDHGRKIRVWFTVESKEGEFDYESILDLFAGIEVNFDYEEFEESFYYTYDEDGNPVFNDDTEDLEDQEEPEEQEEDPEVETVKRPKQKIISIKTIGSKETQSLIDEVDERLRSTGIDADQSFFNLINSGRKVINFKNL